MISYGSKYWLIEKAFVLKIGCIETAVLYASMIERHEYKFEYGIEKRVDDAWYIEYTSKDIKKDTNLSYKKQKKCIDKLIKHGFVKTKLIGIPAKLHYSLIY